MIVSCTEKGTAFFAELISSASVKQVAALRSCGEARRLLLERDFDLVLVNAPLRDETGENFAKTVASGSLTQVILAVSGEHYESVSSECEDNGVLVVAKPINRQVFWSALMLARSVRGKLRSMHTENERLRAKIEELRIVDRAKCLLISRMNISEKEAHRAIEKQAMDMRSTKKAIAEVILRTYEN